MVHLFKCRYNFNIKIIIVIVLYPIILSLALAQSQATGIRAVEEFKKLYGDGWIVRMDYGTGFPYLIYGKSIKLDHIPITDSDYELSAKIFIEENTNLFGFDTKCLEIDKIIRNELSKVGTSDKVTVRFRQFADAMPVRNGRVIITFDTSGNIIAINNDGLQGLEKMDLIPNITYENAINIAKTDLINNGIYEPIRVLDDDIMIVGAKLGNVTVPTVAYITILEGRTSMGWLDIREYVVGAGPVNGIITSRPLIVSYVDGYVICYASKDNLPLQLDEYPLPFLYVTYPTSGQETTNEDGYFYINYSGGLYVTAKLIGVFIDDGVENTAGTNISKTDYFDNTPNQIMYLNTNQYDEYKIAQLNAFYQTSLFYMWVKALDQNHPVGSIKKIKVNIDDIFGKGLYCNGMYDPINNEISFDRAGNGCVNMAYSTIIHHELGHHTLRAYYVPATFSSPFDEGVADTFSTYIWNDPLTAKEYRGPFTYGRTGENKTLFCGNGNDWCHGDDPHKNGEVLMGALWKIRRNLQNSLGSLGGDIANTYFITWLKNYQHTSIHTSIEDMWLVIDDNDLYIGNGTPHYYDINEAFKEQGFPGVEAIPITINHTKISDTYSHDDQLVECTVDVNQPNGQPPIDKVTVYYSTDEGINWDTINLVDKVTHWEGNIPGQVSPETIKYYIVAIDEMNNHGYCPKNATQGEYYSYNIGLIAYIGDVDLYTFEGVGDQGWTHGGSDDWQRDDNTGICPYDPSSSGNKMWGNDTGIGYWDGYYGPDFSNWLQSPSINCSNAVGTRISFKRWLTVEDAKYDQATIKVLNPSENEIWKNEETTGGQKHHLDEYWVEVDKDVSSYADGISDVKICFALSSNEYLEFGGWNIDDFSIYYLDRSPDFYKYGQGHPGSGGYIPQIDGVGNPIINQYVDIVVTQGLGGTTGYLLIGFDDYDESFNGGTLLVYPYPPTIWQPITLSGSGPGNGYYTLANMFLDPVLAGVHVYFQTLLNDSGASHGVSMSCGLEMIVGP